MIVNSGHVIFAILFSMRCSAAGLPEQGDSSSRFEKFDETIRDFAISNNVGAIEAAISDHGEIIHLRSFGFANKEKTKPLPLNARFRIASVTKPITAAAVRTLIRDGKLAGDTHVLDVLKSPPWPQPKDKRWGEITVEHLLGHRGGWDREAWGDPMFMQARIFKETGHAPEKPDDVMGWMMTQPLQFDPGEKSVYANFGYCVLGRMIETVAKERYIDFVSQAIARPCGISSWGLSRGGAMPLKDEVWYDFGIEKGEYFHIWLMDSHGGIVSTASDLCRFMAHYWLSGEPRSGGRGHFYFFGSLPGTTAITDQRADGKDFAVLLNKRSGADSVKWHEQLQAKLEESLNASGDAP
jgi:N-acyl-D-amino-acid deacylase